MTVCFEYNEGCANIGGESTRRIKVPSRAALCPFACRTTIASELSRVAMLTSSRSAAMNLKTVTRGRHFAEFGCTCTKADELCIRRNTASSDSVSAPSARAICHACCDGAVLIFSESTRTTTMHYIYSSSKSPGITGVLSK
jgi:hypothetical protein